ncbi:MAG: hypothetical protein K2X43_02440 [Hyphomonadaceae bacterium]|nr:hypothetical protein [Hyphomonadaceae bacterium]
MASLLKLSLMLTMGLLLLPASPAVGTERASPNDTARFLAGMPLPPQSPLARLTQERSWQQHAETLNGVWDGLEADQLSKIRSWSHAHLSARKPVTYYLFSGPDFLYADAFLPNASTYILAGLEPIGELPDVLKLRSRFVASELAKLRTSLGTLLRKSYFITSEMSFDLSTSQMRGTLPLIYVFLARTGKTIHEVSFVSLAPDGSLQTAADAKAGTRGVKIVFSDRNAKPQTLYYFKTDLSNRGVQSSGFLQFCAQFGIGDIFLKAASYLLHNAAFSTVRDFLLGHGATVVQDDTGIPMKSFQQAGWEVRPFGRYVGPIPVFRGHYQSKLKDLFAKGDAPPIEFGIGYRWRTNQSHVLLALNRTSQRAEIAPPIGQTKKQAQGKIPPPVHAPAPETASVLARWHSILLGGLVTEGLVGLFGLQGVANGLGFVLQTAAIGGIAWLVSSFFRSRSTPRAAAALSSNGHHAG